MSGDQLYALYQEEGRMSDKGNFAIAAFVISLASALFTGWQTFEAHRTPQLTTRPFIAVTGAPSGEHDTDFTIQAGGATAAMSVRVEAYCSYDTHRRWDDNYVKSYPDLAAEKNYNVYDHNDLMLPGMMKPFHCDSHYVPRPPSAPPPGRAVYTRFIRGVTSYDDVYANHHKTEFCYFHPPLDFSDRLVLCPEHNSAD
jgi:hypothetical protein